MSDTHLREDPKSLLCLTVSVLVIVSPVFLLAQSVGQKVVLRVTGSDSMVPRIKSLVELFMKVEPSVTIEVFQGGTVDSGVVAVINGQADLALASCTISPEEDDLAISKGMKLVERLIGYGGIAIIANASTGVKSLTLEQVKGIFNGEIINWKEVGGDARPIRVVRTSESHPGTLRFLEKDFMRSPFTPHCTVVSTFPDVVASVARTIGGVGYVRIREIVESPIVRNNPLIKVISIGRSKSILPVYPSRESVSNQSYPLLRPYYVIYAETAKKEVALFVDFLVRQGWGPAFQTRG
ncbi:MAG: substrate-binding domain-containing protein [Desulfomonilaceae bacterium]